MAPPPYTFASPLSRTINQITQSNIVTDYEYIENRSLGFYVQEEISINDRLYVTGAVRFDDNSTFGADADPLIYPMGTVDYYHRVQQAMGGAEETAAFARLFLAPGVGHCTTEPYLTQAKDGRLLVLPVEG